MALTFDEEWLIHRRNQSADEQFVRLVVEVELCVRRAAFESGIVPRDEDRLSLSQQYTDNVVKVCSHWFGLVREDIGHR